VIHKWFIEKCIRSTYLHLKAITNAEPIFITERITQVKTDIYVTSFGPVSDTEMVSSSARLPTAL